MMRLLKLVFLCLFLLSTASDARFPHGSASAPSGVFAPVKIGNGGIIIRFDIADDGTMVAGTDSYGCYVWATPTTNQWNQQLTDASLGSAGLIDLTQPAGNGCDDIAVDHSNGSIIWTMYGGNLYKSTNKGASYSTTGFTATPTVLSSDGSSAKQASPYTAIDPANSNIVFVSTSLQGLFRTTNGGTSFSSMTALSGGLPCYQGTVINKSGTDTTAHTPAVGAGMVFNNHSGYDFGASGSVYVKVWSDANPMEQMTGLVTADNGAGTSFTLNVISAFGVSSHSDWNVSLPIDGGNSGPNIGCGVLVAYDPSGGTQANVYAGGGNCTKNIFAHTYGINTWKSTDCGQTFTQVNQTNLPAAFHMLRVGPSTGGGVLFGIDDVSANTAVNIWKLDGATWTRLSPPATGVLTYTSVAVDPLNCASKSTCHVNFMAGGNNDFGSLTTDGGVSTWNNYGSSITFASSGDVTWHANYLTAIGNAGTFIDVSVFDPIVSGKLWNGAEGVWWFTPPTSGATYTTNNQTRGIEEFIAIKSITTPNTPGGVFLTTWDFPCFFTNTFNAYPTTVTCQPGNSQTFLERGYSVDWAFGAPSTLAAISQDGSGRNNYPYEQSALTTNGGATPADWTRFTQPAPYAARATGSTISAATYSVTATVTNPTGSIFQMNVTAVSSGSVRVGSTVSGTGVAGKITGNSTINPTACSPNCTGSGGTGSYAIGQGTTAGSTTVSGTYGLFTVGTVTTAQNNLFAVGNWLSATGNVPTGIAAGFGPQMTEKISGTGGTGSTFAVDINTAVASQTITAWSGESGGCIAIKDATHMLWLPGENQAPPQFTTDGGATWADSTRSGGTTGFWGTLFNYTAPAKGCESDKANGDIYVLTVNDAAHSNQFRFYKSTDGGANLNITSLVPTLTGQFNINEFIKSTGVAGHLLFSGGNQATPLPQNSLFYITTDGFTTLTTITGFKTVMAADYGATWPGKTYPGIYAQGWYSGTCLIGGVSQTCTNEYGLWMCKELNTSAGTCNTTWSRLGTRWPLGVLATITDIAADKITPGKVVTWGHGGAYWIQGS
jgi:hypothetical protein